MGRLVSAFFVGAMLLGACGTPHPETAPSTPTTLEEDCTPVTFDLVDADDVEVGGELDEQQRVIAEWALDRFRPGRAPAPLADPSRLRPGTLAV